MTYSIIGWDDATGEMGIATHSYAFAVGSGAPWADPGWGVIATQSITEPLYGELGLELLRSGLRADEALTALRTVDPSPELRQVGMLDAEGRIAVYTGEGCIAEAGHARGDGCCALANMVASPAVWTSMVAAFESAEGSLAWRLLAGLEAADRHGGDRRGRRAAAIIVVRSERTNRPWHDREVDLRIDDHDEPVRAMRDLLGASARHRRAVRAFEAAADGDPQAALATYDELLADGPLERDAAIWRALAFVAAGREDDAAEVLGAAAAEHPPLLALFRAFGRSPLAIDEAAAERVARAVAGS